MRLAPFVPTVFKNLVTRKSTRPYPFVVRPPFPDQRGELIIDIEKCIFCGMCSKKCPSLCITVDKEKGTWVCDPFACVYCGTCEEVCPVDCLSHKETWRPVSAKREMMELTGTPPKKKKKPAAKKSEEAEKPAE